MSSSLFRIGSAYDVHRLSEGDGILLGGIKIPCAYKTEAHSDGDVVYHALAEALLGSLALGDLGTYFPPEDSKTEGMDSSLILKKALSLISEKGYQVSNVDISVILEKPKLRPFIEKIRANLAQELKTEISNVSLKAGTNEGLDAIGEQKAIGCFASVLVMKK
ncbi:MAG: 2-C-methyl-D-erythritol 2,4-cyclodiphosphate synthase [Bacilli bacterium]|jgi:2-C-methyl-D-erythritol 2,4-cyclodiphosphate synthase|nr:2-C-methyl-D-erythritol 2,4-cyclodiphosphate synthase [Bacilli bacterium]